MSTGTVDNVKTAEVNALKKKPTVVTATINGTTVTSDAPTAKDGTSKVNTKNLFGSNSDKMGKQDFLNLLVTQLKYQDPLNPQDNTQFVAQLAQFSSLEGTQNISSSMESLNKNIESLVKDQKTSSNTISDASLVSMIGKKVRVQVPNLAWTKGSKEPLKFNVHTNSGSKSVVSIVDKDGLAVNILHVEKDGESSVSWNGKKSDGTDAPSGRYSVMVTTPDGTADTGYAFLDSAVTGITNTTSGMRLEVAGQLVAMEDIVHMENAKANP